MSDFEQEKEEKDSGVKQQRVNNRGYINLYCIFENAYQTKRCLSRNLSEVNERTRQISRGKIKAVRPNFTGKGSDVCMLCGLEEGERDLCGQS